MNGQKRRQCVHSLDAVKEYVKTYRRIVEVENKDAIFLYRQINYIKSCINFIGIIYSFLKKEGKYETIRQWQVQF